MRTKTPPSVDDRHIPGAPLSSQDSWPTHRSKDRASRRRAARRTASRKGKR